MKRFWDWIKHALFDGFLFAFVWELLEEILENAIAYCITTTIIALATKTFAVVITTQLIKSGGKKILFPIIKKLTYKEGNDKMSKVKQFFTWIWCNKKTLLGTASTAVLTLSGTGVIDVNGIAPLYIGGFNITPLVYYVCLAILSLLGVFGKGIEDIKTFFERVGLIKAEKEKNALIKEAKKEIKAEEKLANQTQAQQEKKLAKEEAEKKAKEEKDKAEAEHKAKVAEIKAQLLADTKKAE